MHTNAKMSVAIRVLVVSLLIALKLCASRSWSIWSRSSPQCDGLTSSADFKQLVIHEDRNRRDYEIWRTVKPECPIKYKQEMHTSQGEIDDNRESITSLFDDYLKSRYKEYPKIVKRIDAIKKAMLGSFKRKADFYELDLTGARGISLDFVFIYFERSYDTKTMYVYEFEGNFNRIEQSNNCNPIGAWSEETIKNARNHYILTQLESSPSLGTNVKCLKERKQKNEL